MKPLDYTYTRYLSSKVTIDDRALNQHVVAQLRRELRTQGDVFHILELGAGVGTMVVRMIEWGLIERARYTLLDLDAQSLEHARTWISQWGARTGRTVAIDGDTIAIADSKGTDVRVELVQAELGAFLADDRRGRQWQLLVAHAFLDLIDVPALMPSLLELIEPGGLYWFSINFDGHTIFEPEHDEDAAFLEVYHRSMDVRVRHGRRAGDSKSGRHLFHVLRALDARISAAGSSDWVVHPDGGAYAADEAYFLHHIVHTVEEELKQWPEVEASKLTRWAALRHAEIERGELVYIAHQLDFVGRRKT